MFLSFLQLLQLGFGQVHVRDVGCFGTHFLLLEVFDMNAEAGRKESIQANQEGTSFLGRFVTWKGYRHTFVFG